MIWPETSKRKMPICVASSGVTGCAAIVMSALRLDVRVDQLGEIHAIDVVARENQVILGVDVAEMARRLPHRIGRALEPVLALGRLLGRQHFDESVGERSSGRSA